MRKVPKLRFREFSDEWEEKKLGEIGKKITLKNNNEKIKTVLTNSAKKGIVKQEDFFDKEITNEKNINNYYIVSKNDFVYNPRISKQAPYGPINKSNIDIGIVSPLYLVFNIKNENVNFLEKYFKSSYWYSYMYNIGNSGARSDRMNIGVNDFFNMPINIPSLQEQEKIANFLSSIDKKISLTEEKLELFREYKKGVMQKIFSKELRFKESEGNDYPEWEEKKLGEILKEYYLGSNYKNSDKLSNFTLIKMGNLDRGKINLKKIEYIDIKENILEKDRLEYGTLLFNTRNTPELVGKVAIWKNELPQAYFNSNLMKMVFDNNFFMNYKFNTNDMIEKLKGIATGTTSVGAIYTKDLLKLVVVIPPSLEEQQKIADFLSSIDSKIESIEKEFEGLKELKKGLLQQMFV